jgi:chromosome segregation ATPase
MRIADLKKEMDGQFEQVRAQFQQVGAQFEQVDARFEQVDVRFEQVDARFQKVDARFENIEAELKALRAEMKTEAETTRRHLDVRAEEFRDYVKVLADGIARNAERLDNHEQRITAIERSGS